ncbi:MAG: MFS transporter, partial [Alphaproteobacteria bacterium]|nr:MFS transporter [Alphaproteobacteria bacterium]
MRPSLRQYLTVTGSYWGFTLSDGALRILVLFHFFTLGYSPFTLALLFLLYEAAGIIANLGGGWLVTRFGIPRMLLLGMALQVLGLMLLSCLDPAFDPVLSVIWVLVAQGIAGLAKDITKTVSKSAIKVVRIDEGEGLFRWVAWFTGSKNAMKGLGFLLGGVMLTTIGFRGGLWLMAGLLGLLAVLVAVTLPAKLGAGVSSKTIRELFSKSSAVNTIAAARIFLFGARDIWFVVALPVFLYANGWSFWEVGGFL